MTRQNQAVISIGKYSRNLYLECVNISRYNIDVATRQILFFALNYAVLNYLSTLFTLQI